ncbi:unnamed protein product [Coffea canephora]|uniref:TraB family protein n=1 Tax=Coffea canephora TaxID=49390 RepID=A0A068UTE8_COFCA|nr:unnamed protein product [Coffea canephora]
MLRAARGLESHHHHLSSFPYFFFPIAKPLHFHLTVRSVPAVVPILHLNHTQSLPPFSTYPNHLAHHNPPRHRVTHSSGHRSSRMDSESEPLHSDSVAAAGAGDGSEDYVHVDDAGAADSGFFGVASMTDSEWRGEENDEVVLRSADGGSGGGGEGEREREGEGGGDGGGGGDERKELPEELSRSVLKLTCESTAVEGGICDVYLVGTAHVSTESCKEVQAVINFLKPEVVFLELCSSRITVLQPQNLKVASQLAVLPGAEFRVAYEEAMKYGAKVILGDRPVQITLRRTWAKMPLWHKTKLLSSLLFQAVSLPSPEDLSRMLKEMDDVDMLTLVIQEMSKQFPTLMETLVHERDKYMSSSLLKLASEHNSVVAVVGKGHLPGIKKHWRQPIEVAELLAMPTHKPAVSVGKILTTIGVALAGVAIASGIYLSVKK